MYTITNYIPKLWKLHRIIPIFCRIFHKFCYPVRPIFFIVLDIKNWGYSLFNFQILFKTTTKKLIMNISNSSSVTHVIYYEYYSYVGVPNVSNNMFLSYWVHFMHYHTKIKSFLSLNFEIAESGKNVFNSLSEKWEWQK